VVVFGDRQFIQCLRNNPISKQPGITEVLKESLGKEGSEVVTKCNRLRMLATTEKCVSPMSPTAETLLRLVAIRTGAQGEPIKLWLAKWVMNVMQEMADPALSLNRGSRNLG